MDYAEPKGAVMDPREIATSGGDSGMNGLEPCLVFRF